VRADNETGITCVAGISVRGSCPKSGFVSKLRPSAQRSVSIVVVTKPVSSISTSRRYIVAVSDNGV